MIAANEILKEIKTDEGLWNVYTEIALIVQASPALPPSPEHIHHKLSREGIDYINKVPATEYGNSYQIFFATVYENAVLTKGENPTRPAAVGEVGKLLVNDYIKSQLPRRRG